MKIIFCCSFKKDILVVPGNRTYEADSEFFGIRVFPDLFVNKTLKGFLYQFMKERMIFPGCYELAEGGEETVREWPVVKGIEDIFER